MARIRISRDLAKSRWIASRVSFVLAIVLATLGLACGGDETTNPEPDTPNATTIGAAGGVVVSESGDGAVSIPPGALRDRDLGITVMEKDRSDFPDPDGRWSDVFEFGPEGAGFDIPVTISLALPPALVDSSATLWTLNESANQWEEVPLSHTSNGRVWGETSHFSAFSTGPASSPDECTFRESISLRTPGNVEVLIADLDITHFVGVGTLFEQETGSRWVTRFDTFTVQGIAGPPAGAGKWIDFATGPDFETGNFDIASDGTFQFPLDIPPLGFRFLGLTDACLAPFATPENGWYYHLEVWCGDQCESGSGNAPGCAFPSTVTLQPNNDWMETFFSFLEGQNCALDSNPVLTRAIVFRYYPSSGNRTATVIAGVNRWEILSSSHGNSNSPANLWTDLPDATDITMEIRDAFDAQAPTYELRFRFAGSAFTVLSFVQQ